MFKPTMIVAVAIAAAAITYTATAAVGRTPAQSSEPLRYQGRTAQTWAKAAHGWQATAERRWQLAERLQTMLVSRVLEARSLRRAVLQRADSREALRLAAITYNVSYDFLYELASCESTGGDGLNPNAKNRSSTAAGLGQFLDSTWSSTIYRNESVYSPYANALAMGKEVRDGHAGWQWAASKSCWS